MLDLDNCTRCLGLYGYPRGNENIINGRILCDDCSVAVEGGRGEIVCPHCERPYTQHKVMDIKMIETAWNEGNDLIICGGEGNEYPTSNQPILVVVTHEPPEDPCDSDFMRGISS